MPLQCKACAEAGVSHDLALSNAMADWEVYTRYWWVCASPKMCNLKKVLTLSCYLLRTLTMRTCRPWRRTSMRAPAWRCAAASHALPSCKSLITAPDPHHAGCVCSDMCALLSMFSMTVEVM